MLDANAGVVKIIIHQSNNNLILDVQLQQLVSLA